MNNSNPKASRKFWGAFSLNVILIGVISFLTDASSEMIVPVLPLFLTEVLAAPMLVVGLIEGLAESTACILKAVSGCWSDKIKKRSPFMLGGYSLSTISKFLFSISTAWQHAVGLKVAERVGKGIRAAPKDALLADSCDPEIRGKVYGFHKAMDTAGAAVGVLIALLLVSLLALGYRTIFMLSAIPATIAVILILFIREDKAKTSAECREARSLFHGLGKFPRELKIFLIAMAILSVSSVMTSFLIILANDNGASAIGAILCYLAFNVVYFMLSMPAGNVSDKSGRYPVILLGYGALFCMFILAFFCNSLTLAFAIFIFYGMTYALTQGTQKALVADLAPPDLRGSALGMYNMAIGIAALPMAIVGGALWSMFGSWATFAFGASVSAAGLAILVYLASRKSSSRHNQS